MAMTRTYHYIGELLVGETASGSRTDFLPDAGGSVTANADQSGTVTKTFRFKPYGSVLSLTGGGNAPRFGWKGAIGFCTNGPIVSIFAAAIHPATGSQISAIGMVFPQRIYTFSGGLLGGPQKNRCGIEVAWESMKPSVVHIKPGYSHVITERQCSYACFKTNWIIPGSPSKQGGSIIQHVIVSTQKWRICPSQKWNKTHLNYIEAWDVSGSGSISYGGFDTYGWQTGNEACLNGELNISGSVGFYPCKVVEDMGWEKKDFDYQNLCGGFPDKGFIFYLGYGNAGPPAGFKDGPGKKSLTWAFDCCHETFGSVSSASFAPHQKVNSRKGLPPSGKETCGQC